MSLLIYFQPVGTVCSHHLTVTRARIHNIPRQNAQPATVPNMPTLSAKPVKTP